MKRTPIKAKRAEPRRNEGRVVQLRVKPRRTERADSLERVHMDRLAAMGCLVCGAPPQIHHVKLTNGSRRRDHKRIAPLCEAHHTGHLGFHGLGSNERFEAFYEIDIVAWAEAQWKKTEQGT